uniref:Uncharacterized protein n=1 Tax=Arundo donax TaxID=35708 RepID=A0A0A9FZF6_ARUDO
MYKICTIGLLKETNQTEIHTYTYSIFNSTSFSHITELKTEGSSCRICHAINR